MTPSIQPRRVRASVTILAASSVFAAHAVAQSWSAQYPPRLATARDVEALSGVQAWVATDAGELRRTTDGGVNWTLVTPGATAFRSVQFATGALGWAGGDGLWRTLDAGQSWVRTHAQPDVEALAFADAANGYAVTSAGGILRTANDGASWLGPDFPAGATSWDDVHAASGGLAWVCGAGGALLATTDGGTTWTPRATGTSADLGAVHFASSTRGWICAGAQIRATTDGGASWTVQTNPTGQVLEDLHFLTELRGWAAGRAGARISTSDGGATWTAGAGGTSVDLGAVEFADFLRGFAVGADGTVAATSDGGATWTSVAGGVAVPEPSVWGIDALDASRAWATTRDDDVLRTIDDGATWTPVAPGVNFQWNDVSFVDALHGYACGEKQAYFPAVAWTSDGGQSWNTLYWGMLVRFHDVEALSPSTALVAGETFVFRTTDGGLTWPSVAPQPYGTYFGMDFVDANTGWIAGTEIFRSDDAGSTWVHQRTPAVTVRDVDFADVQHGFCVGDGASLLRTTDGGATWIASTVPDAPGGLTAVSAVDALHVWVAGESGFVARSSDGGATWLREDAGLATSAQPFALKFTSPTDGWVGGYTGMPLVARRGVACSAPVAYCVPKTNSQGGQCRLGASGPAEYAGAPFSVTYAGALPNQFAGLIYSTNGRASVPFLGGTRCVATPFVRTGNFSTGPGSGARPVTIVPALIGTTRWYQMFYRDVQATDGTGIGLSDGLEVPFCG